MVKIEYEKNEVRNIAYALYVRDWMVEHDEGMPVCFEEFIDNEYMESFVEICELFEKEGLKDWIPAYLHDD